MKKILFVVIAMLLTCAITTNSTYAEDEETLDLNTEDVKNKKEDYSSLTDINGINVFTDDMQTFLKNKEETEVSENKKTKNKIFTNSYTAEKSQDTNNLFKEKVVFDKTNFSNNNGISVTPFIFIGTIFFGFAVFIFTRKYYKWREKTDNENNDNIYE